MAAFTREDVARIARLARLALTEDEQDLFARQLSDILAYAEHVQEVDTTAVLPTSHALAHAASLRADERRPSLLTEDAVASAPDADLDAGLFKVPRVLGG